MAEYIDRERLKMVFNKNVVSADVFNDIIDAQPLADVIERSKVDKAIEELRKEIEENHINVIDYADGEWITKDFIYGAIERLKRNIGE